jgi:hypothetical protein
VTLPSALRVLRWLQNRRQSYQLVSNQPAGKVILADLARFCYAFESCWDPDPRIHAMKEGRRSVWLRVQQHLKLSDAELYQIATGGYSPPSAMEDDIHE